VLERKKYGVIGWKMLYEFSKKDLNNAAATLVSLTESQNDLPLESFFNIVGDVVYGGSVTDEWDLRCLRALLRKFCHREVSKHSFSYGEGSTFRVPELSGLEPCLEFIEGLPAEAPISECGLHENINY